MADDTTFTPYAIPLDGVAAIIVVARYDPTQPPGKRIGAAIPNVRCTQVQYFDGPHPPVARFEYVLDDADPSSPYPVQFEDLWPLDSTNRYGIRNDDELVVIEDYDDGGPPECLFHGFAQVPQVDVTPEGQSVTFTAIGVAFRLWDKVISGRWQRDAIDPVEGQVIPTSIPTRFNPAQTGERGPHTKNWQPNCTGIGADVDDGTATAHPVFLDDRQQFPFVQSMWTLGKAARYLLYNYNDEKYVQNPDFKTLDQLLYSLTPKDGNQFIVAEPPDFIPDPASYTTNPIEIHDFNAENMAMPDVLGSLLEPDGLGFKFTCESDENGEPKDAIEFYRKDVLNAVKAKWFGYQDSRDILDPGASNVSSVHLGRDQNAVFNRIDLEASLDLYEVSVILWPSFQPTAGDGTNRDQFKRSNIDVSDPVARNKYRLWIADETGFGALNTGSGHWNRKTAAWETDGFSFAPVFGFPSANPRGNLIPTYVVRLRPGTQTLISKDAAGRPLRSVLSFSRDYAGKEGVVWDGTGHWQPAEGGWELLKDRLGIYVNVEDVEEWRVGDHATNPQNAGPVLRGITSLSDPTPGTKNTAAYYLMLTTVIEADQMLIALADKRPTSPSKFTMTRRLDLSDSVHRLFIGPTSLYNPKAIAVIPKDAGGNPEDDTKAAKSLTQATRLARENPPIAGSVTIPEITYAYQVGDRVSEITTRNVSFRSNVGASQNEAPDYPFIVALSWEFGEGRQSTTLQLSDRRSEPHQA